MFGEQKNGEAGIRPLIDVRGGEKFLSFWKDADRGIADVEDARKRLAELRQSP